ncbi:MAG TPA: carbohydrate kinase family protein [Devosiaceae bacterium]|nr:carbohydrate kinase family protein [Devosiaceae bacterium]
MRALAAIGNVNIDLIMGPVTPWPASGTEVFVKHDELRPGGAAGNVALAWQAMGCDFQIGANLGNDEFGQFLKRAFGRIGERWPVTSTGTSLSVGLTHPDGERTFFTTLGHLPTFSFGDALACFDVERLRGGILLLCGSFVLPALARDYNAIFDWAEAHGIDVALDTGWPPGGWSWETVARTRGWLRRCRYLLFNEIEAAALAGTEGGESAARALVEISGRPDAEVVVKLGPNGALGISGTGQMVRVPARDIAVVDSIGAGDAFNAGYLYAAASGAGLEAALRQGIDIASAAISTSPRSYAGIVNAGGRT